MRRATLYINMVWLLALVGLTGCSKCAKGGAEVSTDVLPADSVVVTAADDGKHTVDYISRRIDSIYANFTGGNAIDYFRFPDGAPDFDSLFCSQRFLKLMAEAKRISEQEGTICIDADHWIAGQDIDEAWDYLLMKVDSITDTTAQAELRIHNFSDQKVVLDLLFERGNWYVDNFLLFYEYKDYSAEGMEKEEVYPTSAAYSVISEADELRDYIQQSATDREEAKALVGEWGWVGDSVPELLLTLALDKGYITTNECTIYRLAGFESPSTSFHLKSLSISQYLQGGKNIYLSLSLDERGDLTGTLRLNLPEYDKRYDGPITLRKGYFRYK